MDIHGEMCWNWLTPNKVFKEDILDILNGVYVPNEDEVFTYNNSDQRVYLHEIPIMKLRGWGHLTGCCSLALPTDKALEIQDGFGKWIVDTLNGNSCR